LAALAFRDVFSAGVSRYGIGDLEMLAADTHKFESRYMDRLVGPYPEMAEVYRKRSPIHFLDRISCPVLVMQGLEDRVVPPSQAESLVAALTARNIPCAYLAFPGEGHGFRGADAIRRSLDAEIQFLAHVFGFVPADPLEPLDMPGLDAWRQRRLGASATPGEASGPAEQTDGAAATPLTTDLAATQPTSPERDTGDKDAPEAKEELAATPSPPDEEPAAALAAPERPRRRRVPKAKPDQVAAPEAHAAAPAVAPERPKRRRTAKPKASTVDEASAPD
jgi:hypothetical protein